MTGGAVVSERESGARFARPSAGVGLGKARRRRAGGDKEERAARGRAWAAGKEKGGRAAAGLTGSV
jgi:hypothetical protein